MNPSPHINNDPSTVSNELNDLIDAHLTTLTQQHAGVSDPSHPHSLLLRVLHQQFTEHLELQLYNLRQYTTHQQLLIHQFVGNSPPHYPNDKVPGVSCPHQQWYRTVSPSGAEAPHPDEETQPNRFGLNRK